MPKGLGTIHMQKVSCFSFPSFLIRQECLIVRIYKRDDDVLLQHITLSLLLLSLMQMNRALSLRCKEKNVIGYSRPYFRTVRQSLCRQHFTYVKAEDVSIT